MPVTATTREALQAHFGAASLNDPAAYLEENFAAILEYVALGGIEWKVKYSLSTGLEVHKQLNKFNQHLLLVRCLVLV